MSGKRVVALMSNIVSTAWVLYVCGKFLAILIHSQMCGSGDYSCSMYSYPFEKGTTCAFLTILVVVAILTCLGWAVFAKLDTAPLRWGNVFMVFSGVVSCLIPPIFLFAAQSVVVHSVDLSYIFYALFRVSPIAAGILLICAGLIRREDPLPSQQSSVDTVGKAVRRGRVLALFGSIVFSPTIAYVLVQMWQFALHVQAIGVMDENFQPITAWEEFSNSFWNALEGLIPILAFIVLNYVAVARMGKTVDGKIGVNGWNIYLLVAGIVGCLVTSGILIGGSEGLTRGASGSAVDILAALLMFSWASGVLFICSFARANRSTMQPG
jgi:hypothetical protein